MENKQRCLILAVLASGLAQTAQGAYVSHHSFPVIDVVALHRSMCQQMQQTHQMMNSLLHDQWDSSQQSSRMPLAIQEDATTGKVTITVKNSACTAEKHLSLENNKMRIALDDGTLTIWLLPTGEGTALRARLQQESGFDTRSYEYSLYVPKTFNLSPETVQSEYDKASSTLTIILSPNKVEKKSFQVPVRVHETAKEGQDTAKKETAASQAPSLPAPAVAATSTPETTASLAVVK